MPKITRRGFMGTVGASSLAAASFPYLALGQVAPSNQIRMGIIGCGGMGMGGLGAFLANQDVDFRVVCDVEDGRMGNAADLIEAERGHRPEMVKDFRHVIDRNDLDAVMVTTPDHWHALPTVYACQTGKDVYVEKPLARTIDEGRAIVEAARQNKRVVQMGTQWKSAPHYGDAVRFIHSGKLGKVRMVRAWAYLDWVGGIGNPPDGEPPAGVDYDLWLGPAPLRPFNPNRFHFNFRWFWDYAGGLMTDWGVHLLNICLWAQGLETPTRVSCSGGRHMLTDNTETPDTQIAVYDFPSYTLVWEHQMLGGLGPNGHPHGMYFSGEEGAVLIDDRGWRVIPEPKKNSLEAEEHPAGNDGRPQHVRNFLDCIKTREDPVMHVDVGHHVSTVAHLGNLAMRTGQEVHWDAEAEKVTSSPEADALVGEKYREGWELPYRRRT
jgi:predicted dehydrogenase